MILFTDQSRRDRDDRDRPRESSRQRESPNSSRRERDDRERGDRRERDRDRDDNRNHDFLRRERDRDRFVDDDDSRKWRDDGKRDERVSQRRDKDRQDRDEHSRERANDDTPRERELWVSPDETRGQKRAPRERRMGVGPPDSRDRDREDRKDREKEKEPAWMETYVPPPSSAGILGGKGFGNEVDSIQAWKKDMKEREMKAKGTAADSTNNAMVPQATSDEASKDVSSSTAPVPPEGQLDEIQLFKLMMKQAKSEIPSEGQHSPTNVSPSGPENAGTSGLLRIRGSQSTSFNGNGMSVALNYLTFS